MTTQQIVAIALVLGLFAWSYLPNLKAFIPSVKVPDLTKTPDLMSQINSIYKVREANPTPEVQKACNELLAVLLKVK